jgi:hypothetical protein
MAITSFSDLITQINNTLQNFAGEVGLDVTSANSSGATDFSKAMGTFINTPTSPWTSGTIPLSTTGAVRGGTCAIWYKGPVLTSSSFTGGSVVLFTGTNTADELCLVFIMYDKTNNSFTVNLQAGSTGVTPPSASATAPTITVTDVGTASATAPTITVFQAVLFNFRVEDTNKDRILFDSSGTIDGMTSAGFSISGSTISSLTVNTGSTTGHYFTVSSALTYFDQARTIELSGGDGMAYSFDLKHISNDISYPVASPTERWVTVTGGGLGDGTSEANAWTLSEAIANATGGMLVHVKAGNYGGKGGASGSWDFYNVSSTTAANPITFQGYKATAGDITTNYYTWDSGNAVDSTEMPTLGGSSASYGIFSGFGTNAGLVFKNFNVTGPQSGIIISNGTDQWFENINVVGDGVFGQRGINIYGNNTTRITVKNCNSVNWDIAACRNTSTYAYWDGCKAWANLTGSDIQDYYFSFYSDAYNNLGSTSYSVFKNLEAGGGSGVGWEHGLSMASDPGTSTAPAIKCLVENYTCSGSYIGLELRRQDVSQCVVRGVHIQSNAQSSLRLRDGAHDNVIYNLIGEGANGIDFTATTEPALPTPGVQSDQGSAYRNKIINSVFKNNSNAHIYVKAEDGYAGVVEDNEIINCVFWRTASGGLFTKANKTDGVTYSGNTIKNCIIQNIASAGTEIANFTFDYNNIFNSWATGIGTNSSNVDPNFVDAANNDFEPQAVFTSIDAPRISGAEYDYNDNERSATTTMGNTNHQNE